MTASSQLARAVEVLLECGESEPDAPLEEAWRKIQEAVDRNDLVSAVSRVSELAPSPDLDLDEIWRTELVKKFRTVRRFLVLLTETVELRATDEGAPIVAAMRALPDLFGRKKVFPDEVDTTLLRGSWRRLVFLEDETVDWKAYALCGPRAVSPRSAASRHPRGTLAEVERPPREIARGRDLAGRQAPAVGKLGAPRGSS